VRCAGESGWGVGGLELIDDWSCRECRPSEHDVGVQQRGFCGAGWEGMEQGLATTWTEVIEREIESILIELMAVSFVLSRKILGRRCRRLSYFKPLWQILIEKSKQLL
jgi:hypothetical protein